MPDGRRQLLEYQKTVDDKIVYILHRMAIYIELEDKTDYTGSCFDELDAMLVNLKKEALRYMNNHLITEDDYYYEYMQMRARQCVILKKNICGHHPPDHYAGAGKSTGRFYTADCR